MQSGSCRSATQVPVRGYAKTKLFPPPDDPHERRLRKSVVCRTPTGFLAFLNQLVTEDFRSLASGSSDTPSILLVLSNAQNLSIVSSLHICARLPPHSHRQSGGCRRRERTPLRSRAGGAAVQRDLEERFQHHRVDVGSRRVSSTHPVGATLHQASDLPSAPQTRTRPPQAPLPDHRARRQLPLRANGSLKLFAPVLRLGPKTATWDTTDWPP